MLVLTIPIPLRPIVARESWPGGLKKFFLEIVGCGALRGSNFSLIRRSLIHHITAQPGLVMECADPYCLEELIGVAIEHIETHSLPGSDPGLCVVPETYTGLPELTHFGLACTNRVMTQTDAIEVAKGIHLSGHGGTNDGIIGAVAAVGPTAYGWSGRLIEYGGLRGLPSVISVGALAGAGIGVVSIDRDARVPAFDDTVETSGWLRPRLMGGKPVLMVMAKSQLFWESIGKKHIKGKEAGTHPSH